MTHFKFSGNPGRLKFTLTSPLSRNGRGEIICNYIDRSLFICIIGQNFKTNVIKENMNSTGLAYLLVIVIIYALALMVESKTRLRDGIKP